MSQSEYLVLPANAAHGFFPNNKNNHYRIRLPKRLTLQSKAWTIALRSIHYSNNWFNVTSGKVFLKEKQSDGTEKQFVKEISPGRYLDPWTLLSEIRVAINSDNDTKNRVIPYHDENTNTLYMAFEDNSWSFSMSEDLANIFDLGVNKWYQPTSPSNKTVSVRSVPDVFAGHNLMYVYCSLVEPRVVGDAMVPLLMEVPVRTPRSVVENIFQEPSKPQYIPVTTTDTDEVEIDIRRGDGEPFLFRSGVVSVTVELRQK